MWDKLNPISGSAGAEPWYRVFPDQFWDTGIHGALMVLVLVLIGLALRILIRSRRGARDETAMTILEDRFARGEIRRGEFLERKRELS